jgi:hypothetical protein
VTSPESIRYIDYATYGGNRSLESLKNGLHKIKPLLKYLTRLYELFEQAFNDLDQYRKSETSSRA